MGAFLRLLVVGLRWAGLAASITSPVTKAVTVKEQRAIAIAW